MPPASSRHGVPFPRLVSSILIIVAMIIVSFSPALQATRTRSSTNAATFGGRGSIYIDPELAKAIEASGDGNPIKCWFLFHDVAARDTWLVLNRVSGMQKHDLAAGIFFMEPASRISALIDADQGRYITSAWLERQINTRTSSNQFSIAPSSSPSNPGASTPGLNMALNMTAFREAKRVDGQGVIVGLLSTGVGMHPDLAYVYGVNGTRVSNKVIANVSFVDWDPLYVDVNGEGTYLAGIIAGTGDASNGTYTGVAPGARIINAKCVDLIGITIWQWAVSALEFCYSHGADIIVAGWNILGYPGDPLTVAVEEVTRRGITMVAASGDIGPSYMTFNTPGMAASALTVGGADTTTSVIRPVDFSARGSTLELKEKPDVLAPAINLTSCLARLDVNSITSLVGMNVNFNITASYGAPLASNGNYTTVNTTSAAAAYVAGACALLLQNYRFARPETLKDALCTTAIDLGADPNVQGRGLINITAAWEYMQEHPSNMSSARSFTPAMPYAGFVPTLSPDITFTNRAALWFISSYGTLNFFTHFVGNQTIYSSERDVIHLIEAMFGLYHDGAFGFLLMDNVYREMHLTHVGAYSRAVAMLNHQDSLLVVITAETWMLSISSMRLTFDIINVGNTVINDLAIHSWTKADLDLQGTDILGMAADDLGGYDPGQDMFLVNDTSQGPANDSYFAMKASRPSAGHAIGGLTDTISWVTNANTTFAGSAGGDPVDNVTLAAKYPLATMLAPGMKTSIRFSFGCGFDFSSTVLAMNNTLDGWMQPVIHDVVVVSSGVERMYEVNQVIQTKALVINIGNNMVNGTQVLFSTGRVLQNSTEAHVEYWNIGNLDPLEFHWIHASWAPTVEDMYTCTWAAADQETINNLLLNAGALMYSNISGAIGDLMSFDPSNMSFSDFLAYNGSIGSIIGGTGTEDNPLDNLFVRDIFVYNRSRMFTNMGGQHGPYAGISNNRPCSAPMKPEYIGDYALYNLTIYTSVPLTGLEYTISGNASVKFVTDLMAIIGTGPSGPGTIPSTARTGTAITIFIDNTFLRFPQDGHYRSVINFTSDQGFIDTVIIDYTIKLPDAKIFFDTQHNNLLGIMTGDQRDMLMASYHQFYELGKRFNFDMDEYIVFSNYSSMEIQNMSLFMFYDMIVIADPEIGFSDAEITTLVNYYNRGGKIIVLADADMGNVSGPGVSGMSGLSGLSGSSLSGLTSGLGSGLDFSFDFNFNTIHDLLSGAGNIPDSCNITGLGKLVSIFGFQFNESYTNRTTVTNFNTGHAITSGMDAASIQLSSYSTFSIMGNESMNTVLARDELGNPVAAIHENMTSGGVFILVSDSNFIDANHVTDANNSDFALRMMQYALLYRMDARFELSSPVIQMNDTLFIQATLNSTFPNLPVKEVLGIIAYVHVETHEMILLQFFQTIDNAYTTFLASGGISLGSYTFPAFNHTGAYYALITFNHPSVAGIYKVVRFSIVPREPAPPDPGINASSSAFQGVIIFTISTAVLVLIYFQARRKQEESMSVPELNERAVRDAENLLMELQNKLTLISEDILYKKGTEDYRTRLTRLEEKIKFFSKSVKKMRIFKKKLSRF
ncbi:MAG: S8 family serine peptidase [Candidatus Lokiarchaeota archaeon]|nr:S8 family serine peptidase [Candidatus Lokiarchaeota archaeon]